MSLRSKLLETYPPEERHGIDQSISSFIASDDDPMLHGLLEIRQQRIQVSEMINSLPSQLKKEIKEELGEQIATAASLRGELGGKNFWRKLIVSKLATALVIVALAAGTVAWLQHSQNQKLALLTTRTDKLIENQDKLFGFQKDASEAMKAALQATASVYSISQILKTPETVLVVKRNGLSLVVKKGSFTVQDFGTDFQTLFFKQTMDTEQLKEMLSNDGVKGLIDTALKNFTGAEEKPAGQKDTP